MINLNQFVVVANCVFVYQKPSCTHQTFMLVARRDQKIQARAKTLFIS